MIGRVVAGRFRLEQEIGRGGSAVVYRAWDERLKTRVALKALAPHLVRDPVGVARLRREVELAAQIRCAAIAQVHDLIEDGGDTYVVLEFGPGGTLKDHLLTGARLNPQHLDRLLEQLAEALVACHGCDILHRDLKPSNLLYDSDTATIKVIDFGVAHAVGDTSQAAEGAIVGTPEYMAPEQFDDPVPDPRSDLYAAGVVAFEAATGRVPFHGRTLPELARAHREAERPRLRVLNPEHGEGAEAIILHLLEPDPSRRFHTAEEFRDVLAGRSPTVLTPRDEVTAACSECGARREFDLPFCPACGADLGELERFGLWSVRVQAINRRSLDRCVQVASSLLGTEPEPKRVKRVAQAMKCGSTEVVFLDFASERRARWLVTELSRQKLSASAHQLSVHRAIAVALFLSGSISAIIQLGILSFATQLWNLLPHSGVVVRDQVVRDSATANFILPFLLVAAIAFVGHVVVRRIVRRYSVVLSRVSPQARERPAEGWLTPILRAQARLDRPRLRAAGRELLATVYRLRSAGVPAGGSSAEKTLGDEGLVQTLELGQRTLEHLEHLYAMLEASRNSAVRLSQVDAIMRATQSILRLTALLRRMQTKRVASAVIRVVAATANVDETRGALLERTEELASVLQELEALAPRPATTA